MPKASKQTASETEKMEGYEGHFEHFDGGYMSASRAIAPTLTWRRCSRASLTTADSASTGATS